MQSNLQYFDQTNEEIAAQTLEGKRPYFAAIDSGVWIAKRLRFEFDDGCFELMD